MAETRTELRSTSPENAHELCAAHRHTAGAEQYQLTERSLK